MPEGEIFSDQVGPAGNAGAKGKPESSDQAH
jgi:hypothetical protein